MRKCLPGEVEIIKKILLVALSHGLFFTLLNIQAYAYDNGDFQIWNTDVEEVKINNSSKITIEEEFRWGDNASELFYQHYDVGFVYNLNKNINLGAGYRQVYDKKKDKFKLENEPYLMTTLFWELARLKFDSRSRLEYRHFDYQTDLWRYRNKFIVKLPWKFTCLEIQPFLGDEIFCVSKGRAFNENRFSSGLAFSLNKAIKAEIYYMLRSTKSSSKWTDANILGMKLKISL